MLTVNGVQALDKDLWTIPDVWPCVVDTTLMIKEYGGEITDFARNQMLVVGQHWTRLESWKNLGLRDSLSKALGSVDLFPEQVGDSLFLAHSGSGFVFSEMRTGKTFTVLATVNELDQWPVLVACKSANVGEWERQVRVAFPDRSVVSITSGMTASKRTKLLQEPAADFVLIGHNLLEKHSKVLWYAGLDKNTRVKELEKQKYEPKELNYWGFKVVIADEAHRVTEPRNASTRALWALGDKAEHRFALTGTPAPNHEDELWGLLRFCFPDWFPHRSKWLNRYVDMRENQFGILECHGWKATTKKQWDSVYQGLHTRRTRTRGPQIDYRVVPVDLSTAQRRVMKDLAKECLADYEGEILTATDSMSLMHVLSQVACGTPEIEDGKVVGLKAPSSKMDALLEILDECPDKAIVVGEHRSSLKLVRSALKDKGIPFTLFIGGMIEEDRRKAVNDFNNGDARVMIMSSAGAEGIDLPAAKRTIYVERSYSLVTNLQSEARNTGPQQTSSVVEVIDLIASDTLEEDKYQALIDKEQRHHDLLKDVGWLKRKLGVN